MDIRAAFRLLQTTFLAAPILCMNGCLPASPSTQPSPQTYRQSFRDGLVALPMPGGGGPRIPDPLRLFPPNTNDPHPPVIIPTHPDPQPTPVPDAPKPHPSEDRQSPPPRIDIEHTLSPPSPRSQNKIFDTPLENHTEWKPADWGASSRIQLVDKNGPSPLRRHIKDQALLVLPQPDAPQDAKKAPIGLSLNGITLSQEAQLHMDVLVESGRNLSIAVALETTRPGGYYEAKAVPVQPGWTRHIRFPLSKSFWKTEQTQWQYTATVPSTSFRQLLILVYSPKTGQRILFDNISFSLPQSTETDAQ